MAYSQVHRHLVAAWKIPQRVSNVYKGHPHTGAAVAGIISASGAASLGTIDALQPQETSMPTGQAEFQAYHWKIWWRLIVAVALLVYLRV
jgi:hypothetical protein